MAVTRASLVTGPAKIVRGDGASAGMGVLFTQDDVQIDVNTEVLPIMTNAYGQVDARQVDATVTATFTPDGRWDSITRGFLWPYGNTTPGTSIFGSSDSATTITGSDASLHTIIASAVTSMPTITLSAAATMVGPVTIMGVRSNNTDWSGASSLYTAATSGGTFADTTFDPTEIKTQTYTGVWGSADRAGFATIDTESGWTIEFDLQLDPIIVDDAGTVDMRFRSLSVMARCVPIGPTVTQTMAMLAAQGAGAARGRSFTVDDNVNNIGGQDLVITGADASTIVTIKNAGLVTSGFRFGASVLQQGEIGFVAGRPFSSGAPAAIFTLA